MKIVCSVSSGYSSVMMAVKMKEWYPDAEIVNIMANTSREREESLLFMNECDKHFGLNLVWVEADINKDPGKGTRHIVKTFEQLCRDGYVFEDGIIKYGIPSKVNKWCTRELKLSPINSYVKNELGWSDYYTAIGIRADEIDRVSQNRLKNKLIYPLVERGYTKNDRNLFWHKSPVKLDLPAFMGNCKFCHEKSNRKLTTEYILRPNDMDWNLNMECKYSNVIKLSSPSYNKFINRDGGHFSLRGNKSWKTIIELSKRKFRLATDEYVYESDLFDLEGGCGSGCSLY